MSEMPSDNPRDGREVGCCAHITVKWCTQDLPGGLTRGWWWCTDCQTIFAPVKAIEAELKAAREEERQLRVSLTTSDRFKDELHEQNARLVAEVTSLKFANVHPNIRWATKQMWNYVMGRDVSAATVSEITAAIEGKAAELRALQRGLQERDARIADLERDLGQFQQGLHDAQLGILKTAASHRTEITSLKEQLANAQNEASIVRRSYLHEQAVADGLKAQLEWFDSLERQHKDRDWTWAVSHDDDGFKCCIYGDGVSVEFIATSPQEACGAALKEASLANGQIVKPESIESTEIACKLCGADIFPYCNQADYRACSCPCHALRHQFAMQIQALKAQLEEAKRAR